MINIPEKFDELAQMIVAFVLLDIIVMFRIMLRSRTMPNINVIQAEKKVLSNLR